MTIETKKSDLKLTKTEVNILFDFMELMTYHFESEPNDIIEILDDIQNGTQHNRLVNIIVDDNY